MKILITQREIILQNAVSEYYVFDGVERSWYTFLKGHEVVAWPNTEAVNLDRAEFDCLLITGGPDSIARHRTEDFLFELALSRGKPIVGVCHGAFVINDLTGGVNGHCEGHIGTKHKVNVNGVFQMVNSYHSQSIESLGEDFVATGVDEAGNIESFEHNHLPIYGIVWHPERMDIPVLPKVVAELLSL